ncbi:hypothetical protein RB195_006499 [Necator americanus]|uniref:ABC-2 type transporter domain-containing protein n=1 Tax=Necator americanus TaxID=51031 RepID=A0ABR1BSX5_NECAM
MLTFFETRLPDVVNLLSPTYRYSCLGLYGQFECAYVEKHYDAVGLTYFVVVSSVIFGPMFLFPYSFTSRLLCGRNGHGVG